MNNEQTESERAVPFSLCVQDPERGLTASTGILQHGDAILERVPSNSLLALFRSEPEPETAGVGMRCCGGLMHGAAGSAQALEEGVPPETAVRQKASTPVQEGFALWQRAWQGAWNEPEPERLDQCDSERSELAQPKQMCMEGTVHISKPEPDEATKYAGFSSAIDQPIAATIDQAKAQRLVSTLGRVALADSASYTQTALPPTKEVYSWEFYRALAFAEIYGVCFHGINSESVAVDYDTSRRRCRSTNWRTRSEFVQTTEAIEKRASKDRCKPVAGFTVTESPDRETVLCWHGHRVDLLRQFRFEDECVYAWCISEDATLVCVIFNEEDSDQREILELAVYDINAVRDELLARVMWPLAMAKARLCLASGLHPRLGSDSVCQDLSYDVIQHVAHECHLLKWRTKREFF